jgi:hypothetical protein
MCKIHGREKHLDVKQYCNPWLYILSGASSIFVRQSGKYSRSTRKANPYTASPKPPQPLTPWHHGKIHTTGCDSKKMLWKWAHVPLEGLRFPKWASAVTKVETVAQATNKATHSNQVQNWISAMVSTSLRGYNQKAWYDWNQQHAVNAVQAHIVFTTTRLRSISPAAQAIGLIGIRTFIPFDFVSSLTRGNHRT